MTKIDQTRAPFAMPTLPWNRDALAPHISAETVDYHYGKHLQAYVNNVNAMVAGTEFEGKNLEEIVRKATGGLFNNAAQVWNHTMYFLQFSPRPQTAPTGKLAEAIKRDFGSLEAFKENFAKAAMGLFGSGWVWLAADKAGGKLEIIAMPNAGNPLTQGKLPLMVVDVWEHAYYIDHRNARAASIESFWKILDWKFVEARY